MSQLEVEQLQNHIKDNNFFAPSAKDLDKNGGQKQQTQQENFDDDFNEVNQMENNFEENSKEDSDQNGFLNLDEKQSHRKSSLKTSDQVKKKLSIKDNDNSAGENLNIQVHKPYPQSKEVDEEFQPIINQGSFVDSKSITSPANQNDSAKILEEQMPQQAVKQTSIGGKQHKEDQNHHKVASSQSKNSTQVKDTEEAKKDNNKQLQSNLEFSSYSNSDSHQKLKSPPLEPINNHSNFNKTNKNADTIGVDQKQVNQSSQQKKNNEKEVNLPKSQSHLQSNDHGENGKSKEIHNETNHNNHKNNQNNDEHHTNHPIINKHDDNHQQKDELDPKYNSPIGPFSISRNELIRMASSAQQRQFCEEVDFLEKMGGVSKILNGLCTDQKQGISNTPEDFKDRDVAFGNNLQEQQVPLGFIELFCEALNDFTMKILMVAAVFSIIIEVATSDSDKRSTAWIEGFAILVAVFVCATVTAVNDYQKERQFQALNSEADKRKIVTIIRNGQKENKHQSLVMVGDIIDLVEGMEIPADGVVLEASELQSDESAMTGETDPMKKNVLSECIHKRNEIIEQGGKNTANSHDVPSPMVLSGTKILGGSGRMVITVVGEYSCIGKISKLLSSKQEEVTPLQEKLEAIAMDISGFGLKSAILIVLVLFVRFAIEKITQNSWDHSHDWTEMLDFIIIGITVVVVAIPEGLPLSVTLSLAYSVKKMLKDNNLVRKLQACETMGGADCICSDKTGTLTQNKMTLTTWWNEELQDFNKYDMNDKLDKYIPNTQPAFQKLFLQSCAINCSADIRPEEKGSKTEVAVLRLIEKFNEKYEVWRDKYEPELKFPFSSARKRMSVVINSDGKKILLVKGASEMVLASCNKFLPKSTGKIQPIDDALLKKMKDAIKTMADGALRTIVLGYKELKDGDDLTTKDRLGVFDVETKDLTCIAIFGINDILRAEVPDAVKQCQRAGIRVRMVTGDNKDTARAIARGCNILTQSTNSSPYQVIEGVEFIKLTGGIVCKKCQTAECDCVRDQDQAKKEGKPLRVDSIKNADVFDKIYQQIDVMARSRPEDKYAMVVGLIERKHVVAVTGDGTNDAPALKKADVGFAMGIAGTEVARGAAAIILLDDNFKSIVAAVLWGRNIYDSIKKFLQFQLTVNVVAVIITLVGAAIIKQQILQPIQMLWINLIMDTFASLALATEPPVQEQLLRKPHNRDEYIVSKKMFKHIVGQAIYQLVVLCFLVFNGENFLPEVKDSFDDEIMGNTLFDKWWMAKYSDKEMTLVRSGRLTSYSGTTKEYQLVIDKYNQPSRHFTTIFNAFVFMQIFNFLNARKLLDELNIFEGLSRNPLFGAIVGFIIGLQALLVSFGSLPFSCYKNGLNAGNWGISIAFGSGSIFWGFFLKFVSEEKCAQFGTKRVNPINNPSRIISLKGSRHDEASMSRRYSILSNNIHKKAQA